MFGSIPTDQSIICNRYFVSNLVLILGVLKESFDLIGSLRDCNEPEEHGRMSIGSAAFGKTMIRRLLHADGDKSASMQP